MLVGLRLFSELWRRARATLEVRSDNLTALSMVLKMKGKGYGVNLVARELAITLSDCSFRPQIATHIAGLTNKVADTLSRKHQPGKPYVFPTVLNNVKEYITPTREKAYYSAISESPPSNLA